MHSNIEIVIFDLDGTLASTADLDTSLRRVPHDVLKYSPLEFTKSPFLYREELKQELSWAIQCGIEIFVITRAPQAYASTLLQLLGLDYSECIAASSEYDSPESKIRYLQEKYRIPMEKILYIGDMEDDAVEANRAGCQFEYPFWISQDDEEFKLRESSSIYKKLVDEIMKEEDEDSESRFLRHYRRRLGFRQRLMNLISNEEYDFDQSRLLLVDSSSGMPFSVQVFNNPIESSLTFKPAINPAFMTRFEYENDYECFQDLTEVISSIFEITKLVPGPFNARRDRFLTSEIRTFSKYTNTLLGEKLWHKCKNWRNKEIGSGPEVHLHILELVAIVMTSFLTDDAILIPIPSSPYSPEKPGEISKRLTQRICQLRGLNYLDVLSRDENDNIQLANLEFLPKGDYCLVDDQLTDGITIEACLEAFPVNISINMAIMIWSYSASGQRWVAVDL
jgi:phosphoglycolate phosphatase-like HAD superfamily hydrolase